MQLKIIYEDENILVVDKPAGVVVFPENSSEKKTLIDELIKRYPQLKLCGSSPRYGIVHRLDKDTSGVLLVAKDNKTLRSLQKQFSEKKVIKKYLALVVGKIRENQGKIKTLIGRDPKNRKKQRIYLPTEPRAFKKGLREAETCYKVKRRFENFTLLELQPKTGRKHQIRCHLAFIGHPVAGDKLYGFKNQSLPLGLKRHFLHSTSLQINLPSSRKKVFIAPLAQDLKNVINNLKQLKE